MIIIPGVAAAYRSIPLSKNDFIWNHNYNNNNNNSSSSSGGSSSSGSSSSNYHYYHHDNYINGDDKSRFELITPDIPLKNNCLHINNDSGSGRSRSSSDIDSKDCSEIYNNGNYWQIHMPDFKLIKNQFNGIVTTSSPTTSTTTKATKIPLKKKNLKNSIISHNNKQDEKKQKTFLRNKRKLVVTWVVDTIEEVLILLSYGVDGIITNRPIEILYDLQRIYKHYC